MSLEPSRLGVLVILSVPAVLPSESTTFFKTIRPNPGFCGFRGHFFCAADHSSHFFRAASRFAESSNPTVCD